MFSQSVVSTRASPINVSDSLPTNSLGSSTSSLHQNNSVLDFVRDHINHNNNNHPCPDMSLLASLYQSKPESTLPTSLSLPPQPLYRAVMQQFGGIAIDPHNVPQVLNALGKRSSPDTHSSAVAHSAEPISQQTGIGTPNFAMTAAITSALSSNVSVVGPQLLSACSPLLQLAVRQALSQCLPHFAELNIQGHLEITVGSAETTQSTTVLKFNDSNVAHSPVSSMGSLLGKAPTNGFHEPELSISSSSPVPATSTNATNTLTFTSSSNETSQDANMLFGTSSSRRKSTNPIKCTVAEMIDNLSAPGLSMSPTSVTNNGSPLMPTGRSGPTSPSTDSGVLDLSRNGSLAGSAPITPLKDLSLAHGTLAEAMEQHGRHQLLEAYQKQLAAFTQYHTVWNRTMLLGAADQRVNGNTPIRTEASDPASNLFQATKNGALSAPNSPVKPVRRQRMNAGSGLHNGGGGGGGAAHRLSNAVRRPTSNRRFPCNQCREEFPSLHTLEEHTMCQHGTYRCHICKAQFTQRSNLQRHALKHVGFKPFECRVCSKAYYRKDHLMRHMEMGHPGYTPRENITVHLTSSESLDYLNRSNSHEVGHSSASTTATEGTTLHPSPNAMTDHGLGMEVEGEVDQIEAEGEAVMDDMHQSALSHEVNAHRFESTGSPHGSGSFGEDIVDVDEDLNVVVSPAHSRCSVSSEAAQEEARNFTTEVAQMSPETVSVGSSDTAAPSQFDCGHRLVPPTFTPYAVGHQENRKMIV